jgi:hypothetical protein
MLVELNPFFEDNPPEAEKLSSQAENFRLKCSSTAVHCRSECHSHHIPTLRIETGVGALWLSTPVNDSSEGMSREEAGSRLVGACCTTNETKKVKRMRDPVEERTTVNQNSDNG